MTEGGELLVDKAITIPTNGFFELWLPRERLITLSVETLDRKAEGMIGTYRDKKTCITTLRLKQVKRKHLL